MNRGSEACRLLRGSKSTGDDVGLCSSFLPTKVKEKNEKRPSSKQEKVEVRSHKMQIERLNPILVQMFLLHVLFSATPARERCDF